MEKKTKLIIAGIIALLLISITAYVVYAASTDPARFGDGTTTTAWIGGTTGNITTNIGIVYGNNVSYNASVVRLSSGVIQSYTANSCKMNVNSTTWWIAC